MKGSLTRTNVFLLLFCIYFCSPGTFATLSFQAALAPDIQQYFLPESGGWLGADVGTSMLLRDDTYLWLWGDTVIGPLLPNNTRDLYAMPRNTISLVSMGPPVNNSHYYRYVVNSLSVGFFTPDDPTRWFWPTAGVTLNGGLYAFAAQLWENGTGQFSFQQDYSVLISVADTTGNPNHWQYTVQPFPLSGPNLSWSMAGVVLDDWVYVLGSNGTSAPWGSYNTLARIPTTSMQKGMLEDFQFWYPGGVWSSLQPGVALAPLFTGPAVQETTLTWHAGLQLWYLQYLEFMSSSILMRTAPALTGPWSDPVPVFSLPAAYTVPGAFCYAVKSHPEWADPNNQSQIVISFVCNAPVPTMLADLALYVPVFVRVNVTSS